MTKEVLKYKGYVMMLNSKTNRIHVNDKLFINISEAKKYIDRYLVV